MIPTSRLRAYLRRRIGPALGGYAAVMAAFLALATTVAAPVAHEAPAGMAVTATKAKKTCFPDLLEVTGTVVPRREVLVRPNRDGLRIKEILIEPGQIASEAQVLARLGPAGGEQQEASLIAIRAPAPGLIISAPSVIGEMASARGKPLFRLAADADFDLAADVPAGQITRLAPDQPAKVKVLGMDEIPGRVRFISTDIDAATQLGHARISLGRNPSLHIGAFARTTVTLATSCGVAVPLSALLFGRDGPVVQIIRDNRVETRLVAVGHASKGNVQIRNGIAAGDLIVVRAGAFLREGDPVRAVVSRE